MQEIGALVVLHGGKRRGFYKQMTGHWNMPYRYLTNLGAMSASSNKLGAPMAAQGADALCPGWLLEPRSCHSELDTCLTYPEEAARTTAESPRSRRGMGHLSCSESSLALPQAATTMCVCQYDAAVRRLVPDLGEGRAARVYANSAEQCENLLELARRSLRMGTDPRQPHAYKAVLVVR